MLEGLEEQVDVVSDLLKSISNPFRLKILCQLQDGEKTVGQIQGTLQTTTANVSQHLAILRKQGIVSSRKQANFIYNRIHDDRVVELVATLQRLFCQDEPMHS